MADYTIFTDAAADIPLKWYDQYGIQGVPMEYTLSDKTYAILPGEVEKDQICDSFYDALRKGEKTSTTQATPYRYIDAFSPVLKAGNDILYCCFSSGMSGTWHNALLASEVLKEQYPERIVRCVDTLSSSAGQGLIVIQAAALRERGQPLEENAKWLEEHFQNMNHWFLVDDLDFLKQGGRISPTVAFLGSKLQIKPILTITPDGRLVVAEKERGRRQSMRRLVELFRIGSDFHGVLPVVFINYAGCREDGELLADMVREVAPPDVRVFLTPLSPFIGAHTGPGMLSVCFWGKRRSLFLNSKALHAIE